MLLESGAIVVRRNFTQLPIPREAIDRVEELAGENDAHVTFRYGNTIYSTADPPEELDLSEEVDGTIGADPIEVDIDGEGDDMAVEAEVLDEST